MDEKERNCNTRKEKSRRRSSILKPPRVRYPLSDLDYKSTVDDDDCTASKIPRRVSFASNNTIKPFTTDEHKNTIWDSTYEEEITPPEGQQPDLFSSNVNSHGAAITKPSSLKDYQRHSNETQVQKTTISTTVHESSKEYEYCKPVRDSFFNIIDLSVDQSTISNVETANTKLIVPVLDTSKVNKENIHPTLGTKQILIASQKSIIKNVENSEQSANVDKIPHRSEFEKLNKQQSDTTSDITGSSSILGLSNKLINNENSSRFCTKYSNVKHHENTITTLQLTHSQKKPMISSITQLSDNVKDYSVPVLSKKNDINKQEKKTMKDENNTTNILKRKINEIQNRPECFNNDDLSADMEITEPILFNKIIEKENNVTQYYDNVPMDFTETVKGKLKPSVYSNVSTNLDKSMCFTDTQQADMELTEMISHEIIDNKAIILSDVTQTADMEITEPIPYNKIIEKGDNITQYYDNVQMDFTETVQGKLKPSYSNISVNPDKDIIFPDTKQVDMNSTEMMSHQVADKTVVFSDFNKNADMDITEPIPCNKILEKENNITQYYNNVQMDFTEAVVGKLKQSVYSNVSANTDKSIYFTNTQQADMELTNITSHQIIESENNIESINVNKAVDIIESISISRVINSENHENKIKCIDDNYIKSDVKITTAIPFVKINSENLSENKEYLIPSISTSKVDSKNIAKEIKENKLLELVHSSSNSQKESVYLPNLTTCDKTNCTVSDFNQSSGILESTEVLINNKNNTNDYRIELNNLKKTNTDIPCNEENKNFKISNANISTDKVANKNIPDSISTMCIAAPPKEPQNDKNVESKKVKVASSSVFDISKISNPEVSNDFKVLPATSSSINMNINSRSHIPHSVQESSTVLSDTNLDVISRQKLTDSIIPKDIGPFIITPLKAFRKTNSSIKKSKEPDTKSDKKCIKLKLFEQSKQNSSYNSTSFDKCSKICQSIQEKSAVISNTNSDIIANYNFLGPIFPVDIGPSIMKPLKTSEKASSFDIKSKNENIFYEEKSVKCNIVQLNDISNQSDINVIEKHLNSNENTATETDICRRKYSKTINSKNMNTNIRSPVKLSIDNKENNQHFNSYKNNIIKNESSDFNVSSLLPDSSHKHVTPVRLKNSDENSCTNENMFDLENLTPFIDHDSLSESTVDLVTNESNENYSLTTQDLETIDKTVETTLKHPDNLTDENVKEKTEIIEISDDSCLENIRESRSSMKIESYRKEIASLEEKVNEVKSMIKPLVKIKPPTIEECCELKAACNDCKWKIEKITNTYWNFTFFFGKLHLLIHTDEKKENTQYQKVLEIYYKSYLKDTVPLECSYVIYLFQNKFSLEYLKRTCTTTKNIPALLDEISIEINTIMQIFHDICYIQLQYGAQFNEKWKIKFSLASIPLQLSMDVHVDLEKDSNNVKVESFTPQSRATDIIEIGRNILKGPSWLRNFVDDVNELIDLLEFQKQ